MLLLYIFWTYHHNQFFHRCFYLRPSSAPRYRLQWCTLRSTPACPSARPGRCSRLRSFKHIQYFNNLLCWGCHYLSILPHLSCYSILNLATRRFLEKKKEKGNFIETYLSNIRKSSASSSSDFPLLSSFMQRTIMTKNSSKSTVPLPVNANQHLRHRSALIIHSLTHSCTCISFLC